MIVEVEGGSELRAERRQVDVETGGKCEKNRTLRRRLCFHDHPNGSNNARDGCYRYPPYVLGMSALPYLGNCREEQPISARVLGVPRGKILRVYPPTPKCSRAQFAQRNSKALSRVDKQAQIGQKYPACIFKI